MKPTSHRPHDLIAIPLVLPCAALAAALLGQAIHAGETTLVRWVDGNRQVTGLQLVRTPAESLILATDGQLHHIESTANLNRIEPLSGEFIPDSVPMIRSQLSREFGPLFEVATTKHFLVVQPRGRGSQWPDMFETLHREFAASLKRRGVQVLSGKFMMVAIVMPDRAAMYRALDRQNIRAKGLAGIYVVSTNRVYTFDGQGGEQSAATVRHEAAHQSAYNSNVHSRLNETPKWLTEGLGMLYEPAAMSQSPASPRVDDRVNRLALDRVRQRYADPTQSIAADVRRLVSDDTLFDSPREVHDAYAVAWLMMFYLAERKPSIMAAMLNHTSTRPPFVPYGRRERLADFHRITGKQPEAFGVELAGYLKTGP